MTAKQQLVVIGNGMAGARLVEEVLAREGRARFDITVFGAEPYGNYNRILLANVLSGAHDPQAIFLNPLSWYAEQGVTLHAGVRVGWIDRLSKTVHAPGGVMARYDKLVIATGSAPFVPPIEGLVADAGPAGAYKEGVFVFRTIDDCNAISAYAARARTATVIGGGLLGLEAARGLLSLGLDVHVVHLMRHLMEVQLDAAAGSILAATLEKIGLRIHLEKATAAVLGEERVAGIRFSDGATLESDLLVVSAGIRPNTDLARQAGLHIQRGIVVHDDLSCRGDADVYAIGECAQHRGQVYGLVAPAWEQARVLADRLTGRNPSALYRGSKLSTKLKVMDVELTVVGDKDPRSERDEVVSYSEPARGVYKKLIVRDDQLAGAILLGDGAAAPNLLQTFDRAAPLPENRGELLFPLGAAEGGSDVTALPETAQICNCNGVSKAAILAAIADGCRSLADVCAITRAGTGCGTCKPDLRTIFEAAVGGLGFDDPSQHYYVPGVPLSKPALIEAIKTRRLRSVSAVFAALSEGVEDPGSKAGLASLLKTIWGKEYDDERDARFINDRVHANIQKDGSFSVVPRIYGGVTTPEQLRRIADVADKYRVPMVKITGGQRIDLLGIARETLPQVWKDLGMPSGHAYQKAFRTCKTCVGTEFCRYGVGDSTALGIRIEQRFQGIESPHKLKLATAGCPRNCSEATTKDLGAVAIEGGRWEVYIGGAAGSRVRKGDVLCVVDSHEAVLTVMGRFMQYYREQAKYLERTPAFVERLGLETLRQLLVDDAEGICARLDAEIEAAVDAYEDPWTEAAAPIHPAQFARVLPLPGVEVDADAGN